MTFCDWSAAHSLTSHCSCLRKSHHLSLWAWMVVECTIHSGLCLISASVYQRSRKWLQQKRKRKRGVSGGLRSGSGGCFTGCFSVSSASLKMLQTLELVKHRLVLPLRWPTSLYRSTVCVNTNIHMVSVCLRNPPNCDTDYRIFSCAYMVF